VDIVHALGLANLVRTNANRTPIKTSLKQSTRSWRHFVHTVSDRSEFRNMSSSTLRLYCKVLVVDPPTLVKLDVAPSATVLSVLQRIECGEPAANLALVHEGDELRTDATLEAKGISNNATLHVICTKRTLRLRAPSDSPAAHPPAALARRLRLDAARSRQESLVDLQRARTVETIVPSATPGALQQRLNEAAFSMSAAAAAASDSDSEEGAADDGDDEDEDEPDEESGGAEAVLPRWARGRPDAPPKPCLAPDWTHESDEPPDDCLRLQWATGFTPHAGLGAVNGNEVVYACGALGIVHSSASSLQQHLCGHRAAVRALSVHPAGRLVATAAPASADGAAGDEVLIWDSKTGELSAALPCASSLSCLAFDRSGETLATLAAPPAAHRSSSSLSSSSAATRPKGAPPPPAPSVAYEAPPQVVTLWRWRDSEVLSVVSVRDGPYRYAFWHRPVSSTISERLVLMAPRTLVLLTAPRLDDACACTYTRQVRWPMASLMASLMAALTAALTTSLNCMHMRPLGRVAPPAGCAPPPRSAPASS
jgi:hypothetical protein